MMPETNFWCVSTVYTLLNDHSLSLLANCYYPYSQCSRHCPRQCRVFQDSDFSSLISVRRIKSSRDCSSLRRPSVIMSFHKPSTIRMGKNGGNATKKHAKECQMKLGYGQAPFLTPRIAGGSQVDLASVNPPSAQKSQKYSMTRNVCSRSIS